MIQREWQRVDPKFLDDDEQRFWATIAGRQIRFDQRAEFARKFAEGRADKGALETFLAVCAAENPNRRLRMTALADRVATPVERADFDDLVTLVTPGAAVGEGSRGRRADPAPRARRRQGGRARPDPRAAGRGGSRARCARRSTARRARSSRRRSACSARSPTRAATGTRRTSASSCKIAAALPLPVGAALLASAEGYTPRANGLLDQRPRGARPDRGDRDRARREPARAEGARPQVAPPATQEAPATARHRRRRRRRQRPRRPTRRGRAPETAGGRRLRAASQPAESPRDAG